jgi:hypothetical protein
VIQVDSIIIKEFRGIRELTLDSKGKNLDAWKSAKTPGTPVPWKLEGEFMVAPPRAATFGQRQLSGASSFTSNSALRRKSRGTVRAEATAVSFSWAFTNSRSSIRIIIPPT